MLNRKLTMALVVLMFAVFTSGFAFGEYDDVEHSKVRLDPGKKAITIYRKMRDDTFSVKVPSSYKGIYTIEGNKSSMVTITFDTSPGDIELDMTKPDSGSWNKKVEDGKFLNDQGEVMGTTMGSLYPSYGTGTASILGEYAGTTDIAVTGVTVTVVSDRSLLNLENWWQATGTTYTLPDGVLAAGSVDVPWGSVNYEAGQGLLITAQFDGATDYMGYNLVPEPTTLSLLALGSLALLRKRK
jgi:hypothetical protein